MEHEITGTVITDLIKAQHGDYVMYVRGGKRYYAVVDDLDMFANEDDGGHYVSFSLIGAIEVRQANGKKPVVVCENKDSVDYDICRVVAIVRPDAPPVANYPVYCGPAPQLNVSYAGQSYRFPGVNVTDEYLTGDAFDAFDTYRLGPRRFVNQSRYTGMVIFYRTMASGSTRIDGVLSYARDIAREDADYKADVERAKVRKEKLDAYFSSRKVGA